MSRRAKARMINRRQALSSLLAIATLPGCVGLGGNIKGSFACQAPDGICAPSAVIDDRALAMISDDPLATPMPAGPYREKANPVRVATRQPVRSPVGANTSRSNERVLRIVFPAHIDERGRLHEESAVHAVVSQGEWLTWTGEHADPARGAMTAAPEMPSLADALGSEKAAPLEVDPNLPDPAIVAAARARTADPVAAIKADVAERLKPPSRTFGAGPAQSGKVEGAPAASAANPTVKAASFPAAVAED